MDGTAYVRVDGSPDAVREALPDLAGVDGVRLVIDGHGSSIGPPAGSAVYRARWSAGRTTGAADVLVMPISTWGSEVHLTIRPPRSVAAVLWSGRRLSKLAASLAIAIRQTSAP